MIKCKFSNICGACTYQGMNYKEQLKIKQDRCNKLLSRFNKVQPIIGMENCIYYRNKVQVSFGYDKKYGVICGNYETSTHKIVQIDDCIVNDDLANKIISSFKNLVIKYELSIFNENTLKGCIRHLLIKCTKNNEYMLVIVTGSLFIKHKDEIINELINEYSEIKTIVQNINNKHTSMIFGKKTSVLYGDGYIYDDLCNLTFRISPTSFYQVNKRQTEVLYNKIIELAKFNKNEIVIDAYCGTGTIGLVASKYCKKVYGVEINKDAVKDAINNKKINNIDNAEFVCDDAGKYMQNLALKHSSIDAIIMDPPRTGSDKKFINAIFKLSPRKIVYVSCNPETLKNDLSLLNKYYKVVHIQPIDMFPYTEHVENVVMLIKK